MPADLPVLEWDEAERLGHADVAELGVVRLMAWGNRWRVEWYDDHADGQADSREDAKSKARAFAKTLLQQTLAQIDRTHDPVTGLVVQLGEERAHG